jgi:integrase
LVENNHLARNVFETIPVVKNIGTDRKLVRRALTDEQLERLIATAHNSRRSLCKLSGPARSMLYRLNVNCGLRRNEAASLTPASFQLVDEGVSAVIVESAFTKNKLRAVIPLLPAVVPLLRGFIQGLPEDELVWPLTAQSMTAIMVQKDMAEAGLNVEVGGTTFDFHSLRGQYATRLTKANIHFINAAKLLIYSGTSLNMAVYTHLTAEDLASEVNKLG